MPEPFGLVVGKVGGEPFATGAGEPAATAPALTLVVEALPTVWRCAAGWIAQLDPRPCGG